MVSFSVYSPPEKHRIALLDLGLLVTNCAKKGRKEAADHRLVGDLLKIALEHGPSGSKGCDLTIVLVSGDSDFAYAISLLRSFGYTVWLIHPRSCSKSLRTHAHVVHEWNAFLSPGYQSTLDDVVGVSSDDEPQPMPQPQPPVPSSSTTPTTVRGSPLASTRPSRLVVPSLLSSPRHVVDEDDGMRSDKAVVGDFPVDPFTVPLDIAAANSVAVAGELYGGQGVDDDDDDDVSVDSTMSGDTIVSTLRTTRAVEYLMEVFDDSVGVDGKINSGELGTRLKRKYPSLVSRKGEAGRLIQTAVEEGLLERVGKGKRELVRLEDGKLDGFTATPRADVEEPSFRAINTKDAQIAALLLDLLRVFEETDQISDYVASVGNRLIASRPDLFAKGVLRGVIEAAREKGLVKVFVTSDPRSAKRVCFTSQGLHHARLLSS